MARLSVLEEAYRIVAECDKLAWVPKSEYRKRAIVERLTTWNQLVEVGDYVVVLRTVPYDFPGSGRGRTGTVFVVNGFTDFNWAILSNGRQVHCRHLLHI